MWDHGEDEIRELLEEELDENYRLGISMDDTYLSITIEYDDEPAFLGETIDSFFEGDYELRASIDSGAGTSSYVIELRDRPESDEE